VFVNYKPPSSIPQNRHVTAHSRLGNWALMGSAIASLLCERIDLYPHLDFWLLCDGRSGLPPALATPFNKATNNITWVPKNTRDSAVQSYFVSVQQELAKNTLLDIAYVGNPERQPEESSLRVCPSLRELAQRYYFGAQRVLLSVRRIAGSL
jgi:hypothetical protein